MMTDGTPLGALARRLTQGTPTLAAWCTLGDATVAELLVRQGFDTAVLDMQHGVFTLESAIRGIVQLSLAGAPAIVRIPVDAFPTTSQLLDAGAAAVIAPMVNSAADARRFAGLAKYPPRGERSWGPHRALSLSGLDGAAYLAEANDRQLAIAMVETREALAALDEILAVPGLDGVFVGPSDLSIALSGGQLDPEGQAVEAALDHVAQRSRAAGKFAALFCADGARARAMFSRGFVLCSASTDARLLQQGAALELTEGSASRSERKP
jgi:4-hydroxy-2-oxoheptanedioate aldolase